MPWWLLLFAAIPASAAAACTVYAYNRGQKAKRPVEEAIAELEAKVGILQEPDPRKLNDGYAWQLSLPECLTLRAARRGKVRHWQLQNLKIIGHDQHGCFVIGYENAVEFDGKEVEAVVDLMDEKSPATK